MSPANLAHSAGSPPSGARVFGLRDLGLTFERLGQEEVGFGVVAWLCVGPASRGLHTLARPGTTGEPLRPPILTHGDGVRGLQIGETGQVPELQVENRGEGPLLLPAHLVLSGGWQTRAVERSVIVPGGGSVRVPVKCVEAGRWAPRDEQTARSFEVSERTGVRTRWSTSRSMADQLARHGRFAAEQSAVWQQVDEELTRNAVASRTRSYEAYLQGVKRHLVAEAQRADVHPPAAANAVAIFPRGGGFWVEAYPSAEALAEHADDLLSDLFDPGSRSEGKRPAADRFEVDRVLDALWAAPLQRLDRIEGTTGDSFAISEGPERAAGAVVTLDGALAHLAVGAAPAREDNGISGDRPSNQPEGREPGESVRVSGPLTRIREADSAARAVTMGEPPKLPARPVTMGEPPKPPARTMAPQGVPAEPSAVKAIEAPSAKSLFAEATAAREAGNAHAAAQALDALRRRFPLDAHTPLATFELGRIRMDRLGDRAGALEALRSAIAIARGAAFSEDAEARVVELLDKMGRTSECGRMRAAFLARRPGSIHEAAVTGACPVDDGAASSPKPRPGPDRAGDPLR